jgi:hypothetical protein
LLPVIETCQSLIAITKILSCEIWISNIIRRQEVKKL